MIRKVEVKADLDATRQFFKYVFWYIRHGDSGGK